MRSPCSARHCPFEVGVNKIDTESFTQEDVLETFPSVGRGFPRLAKLPDAVGEYQRIFPGIHGLLIEHVGMVAVEGMPQRVFQHRTAHGKTALLGYHQDVAVFSTASCKQQQEANYQNRFHNAVLLFLYFGFLQGIISAAYNRDGRYRLFQLLHLFGRERNLRGTEVLLQMRQLRGAGDRYDELTLVH